MPELRINGTVNAVDADLEANQRAAMRILPARADHAGGGLASAARLKSA
jgi:hypothetical protein